MSSSSEGLIDRLRGLVDLSHEKTMTEDWTVFKREIEGAIAHIEQIESRVKRRDDTIRELRRTVMLELLSLQTIDSNDANRNAIQKNTINRLRQDEIMLVEWREKANKLKVELERVHAVNSAMKMNVETEKKTFRHKIDELEFQQRELMEYIKTVNADMKYLNIVMIGKDAIIEKQYTQLQEKDAQCEALFVEQVTLKAEKATSTSVNEALRKENEELQRRKENNYLLERLDLVKQENITMKKSLADYKAGYNNLTEKCQTLADSLAATKESLDHAKHYSRRKSKSNTPTIPENTEGNCGEPSLTGEYSLVHSHADTSGKRRKSSRMSILRKKSLTVNSLTNQIRDKTTETSTSAITTSYVNIAGDDNQLNTECTEDKECQVNIDSSKYANVRMGNEEEVVVKALYRRVSELEDLVQDRQIEIDNMLLEMNGKALQVKRKMDAPASHCGTDIDLSAEYQTQSYEEFLSLKSDEKVQRKQIDDLETKIRDIQKDNLTKQTPEPVMESKTIQCESTFFVAEASVQAVAEAKEFSTQTSRHTPISNHQTIEDPFYSYIFKELLDVCKHVVTTNLVTGTRGQECDDLVEGEMQDSIDTGRDGTTTIIAGCKNLISSLTVLRKDLFEEMKYRGGDFNTLRSRSFLRCIEVVIRAFHKIINNTEKDKNVIEKQDIEDEPPDTTQVDSSRRGLLMSPMTLRMAQFKHDNIPIYEYDYNVNKVLFSCIETPTALPATDHFGGGAPKGTLVKPSNISSSHKNSNNIKHCETKELGLLANSNWVIPRVSDSFCDSFVESSTSPPPSSPHRQPQVTVASNDGNGNIIMPINTINISPTKFGLKSPHHSTPSKRVYHKTNNGREDYIEEFFAISRPLSAQKEKSKLSPRHMVLVEKNI